MIEATLEGTAPLWWCAAAWVRALHAANVARFGREDAPISLEIPVRLPPRHHRGHELGNRIVPVIAAARGDRPPEEIARALRRQFRERIRRREHLGIVARGAPGALLPWRLFRRLAMRWVPATGSATGHFNWLRAPSWLGPGSSPDDGRAPMAELRRVVSPVCLDMGTALVVVAFPSVLRVYLWYRPCAVERERAADMLGGFVRDVAAHAGSSRTANG